MSGLCWVSATEQVMASKRAWVKQHHQQSDSVWPITFFHNMKRLYMTSATTPMTRPKGECFPSILVYPGPSGQLSGWGLFIFAFYVWRLKSHSLSLSASDGSTDVQKDFADGFRVSVFSLFFVPRNINTSKQTACCKGCPLKTVTKAKPQYQDSQWNHKS